MMASMTLPKAAEAVRSAAVPVAGEILYDKDEKKLYYGDGVTRGGLMLVSGNSIANLEPGNIRHGVTILGVTGTYEGDET